MGVLRLNLETPFFIYIDGGSRLLSNS